INGHQYVVSTRVVDREGHVQKVPSTRSFTFKSPVSPPTLVLTPSATVIKPNGTVTFTMTVPQLFAGQKPPTGFVTLYIDGRAYKVAIQGGKATLTKRLPAGPHTVWAFFAGDEHYPSLFTSKIRVKVTAKQQQPPPPPISR